MRIVSKLMNNISHSNINITNYNYNFNIIIFLEVRIKENKMSNSILSLEYSSIHSFYYISSFYQSLDKEDGSLISIPTDRYWIFQEGSNIEDECNLPHNIEEFILLLAVCDFWGFEELPLIAKNFYQKLSRLDKEILFKSLNETILMGEHFSNTCIEELENLVST